jgi:hypothetical protein
MRLNLRNISTRMIWVILIILIIMSFPSCGPSRAEIQSKYDNTMQSFIGKDINDLIRTWGAPQQVYEMPNGNKLYTFSRGQAVQQPVVTIPGQPGYNRSAPSYTIGGGTATWYCILNFETNPNNEVIHGTYEGNNCF